MTRLTATLKLDVLNQFRLGFYYASLFVMVAFTILIGILPPSFGFAIPVFLLTNMVIATFVFIGTMLLLEKGDRTLEGQIVTPLRTDEYLASKIITLAAVATLENCWVTGIAQANGMLPGANWIWMLAGSILSAVLYTLLGLLTVIRYDSLNDFLMPMIGVTMVLQLPALVSLGMPEYGWLYLLPTHGPMLLFQSSVEPKSAGQLVYAVLYPSLWIGGAYWLGRKALRRFVTEGIGD